MGFGMEKISAHIRCVIYSKKSHEAAIVGQAKCQVLGVLHRVPGVYRNLIKMTREYKY